MCKKMCRLSFALLSTLAVGCATVQPVNIPPTAAGGDIPSGALLIDIWTNVANNPALDNSWHNVALNEPVERKFGAAADVLSIPYDGLVVRFSGYFVPPEDGNYILAISGEQSGVLYFAESEDTSKQEIIASFPSPTGRKVWNKFESQTSRTFALKAGLKYSFDSYGWDKAGYDYLAVGWSQVYADGTQSPFQVLTGESILPRIDLRNQEADALSYELGYRVGYTDGRYSFPFDASFPFKDSDKDGLPDNWEIAHGMDPLNDQDALLDLDNDGLYALLEFMVGTNPKLADSDGDGLPDGWEYRQKLDPLNAADAHLVDPATGLSFLALYKKEAGPEFVLRFSWQPTLTREDGSAIAPEEISTLIVRYGQSSEALDGEYILNAPKAGHVEVPVSGVDNYFVSLFVKDSNGRLSSASAPAEFRSVKVD